MAKKVKSNKNFQQIGEAIRNAWIAGATTQTIDRQALLAALELDGSSKKSDQNIVVYDIITDQEIDDNTRMVWISIPTPDVKKNGNWNDYINDEFGDNDPDLAEKLRDLGKAALFGCGR